MVATSRIAAEHESFSRILQVVPVRTPTNIWLLNWTNTSLPLTAFRSFRQFLQVSGVWQHTYRHTQTMRI